MPNIVPSHVFSLLEGMCFWRHGANADRIAYKPSPEAGSWNQAYFETLVKNAKPSFA